MEEAAVDDGKTRRGGEEGGGRSADMKSRNVSDRKIGLA
jgi:hypothetical protein